MAVTIADSPRNRLLAHTAAALLFVAMAVLWTMPLAQHVSTAILGSGAGDNVASLWNFWWMRYALEHHLDPSHTGSLFAPNGTSLALHTHVALPALAGATILRSLPLITAHNVLFLITFVLNAVCAYALVHRLTREWLPAVLGAVVFAGSPFVAAHMNGHFNLVSAWTLPLVAMAAIEMANGSRRWAVVAGLLCGATVYLDYYYTLYAVALVVAPVTMKACPVTVTFAPVRDATSRLRRWILGLIILDVTAIAAIAATGGFEWQWGAVRIRAYDTFNAWQLLWTLLALWAWLRWRPRVTRQTHAASMRSGRAVVASMALAIVPAVAVASPLLVRVGQLVATGEYVSQTSYWKSGAQGIDVATLLLGNPFSRWYGGWARSVDAALAIDAIERAAWLGLVPIALAIVALRDADRRHAVRWTVIGAAAFLWALGPHLTIAGQNTGMILPEAILRYLPVVSNARIPGRALVIVYLALAVLSGLGLSRLRRRGLSLPRTAVLFALLIADFVPAPFPLMPLDSPPIYELLRARPETGAVCALPLGVRDGFGESGALDHRVLFYQSIHERPLVGGFVARLAPSIRRTYEADPLMSTLLRLSAALPPPPSGLPDRAAAQRSLQAMGIRFVMLDTSQASDDLVRYVEQQLPVTPLAGEGPYRLYIVHGE